MIRVTIELYPFGDASRAKTLGVMDIANDGSGTRTKGNYIYRAWKAGTPKNIPHTRANCQKAKWAGYVEGFPRTKLIAWDLVSRCLQRTFGHRNP